MVKKILKDIRTYFVGIYGITSIFFLVQLFISKLLPVKYILVVTAILALFGFFIWWIQYSKKTNKSVKVLGKILSVILSIFLIIGNLYLNSTTSLLRNMFHDSNTTEISVVVMKDSPLESIEDVAGKTVGISILGDTSYNDTVVNDINKDVSSPINKQDYSSVTEYKDALYNGEVDAIILNEGMRGMLEEEIETFTQDTRILKTYSYESEAIDIAKRVDVTEEPFVVYISGIDTYGAISTVSRSDVNKIMVVNPNTHQILLIDIPRDYYIPQVCQGMQNDKLTHTGIFGVECTVNSVADYFDIDVNYYIRVNFSSVVDIVDALGGITVTSDYAFSSQGYSYSAGENYLDGASALAFSRERYSLAGGDNARIENQSVVLKGIINKAISPSIITNYMGIMSAVGNSFQTNMSNDEITSLINDQIDSMSGWEISNYAVQGTGGTDWTPANGFNAYVMYPDTATVEQAKQLIQDVYDGKEINLE